MEANLEQPIEKMPPAILDDVRTPYQVESALYAHFAGIGQLSWDRLLGRHRLAIAQEVKNTLTLSNFYKVAALLETKNPAGYALASEILFWATRRVYLLPEPPECVPEEKLRELFEKRVVIYMGCSKIPNFKVGIDPCVIENIPYLQNLRLYNASSKRPFTINCDPFALVLLADLLPLFFGKDSRYRTPHEMLSNAHSILHYYTNADEQKGCALEVLGLALEWKLDQLSDVIFRYLEINLSEECAIYMDAKDSSIRIFFSNGDIERLDLKQLHTGDTLPNILAFLEENASPKEWHEKERSDERD